MIIKVMMINFYVGVYDEGGTLSLNIPSDEEIIMMSLSSSNTSSTSITNDHDDHDSHNHNDDQEHDDKHGRDHDDSNVNRLIIDDDVLVVIPDILQAPTIKSID